MQTEGTQPHVQANARLSTRQLLDKIPNYPCLFRHRNSGIYYGIKKVAGKRKERSLETKDRKLAERKLRDWISSLDKIDTEAEKITLEGLIEKFQKTRQGKAAKTKQTEEWIINKFKAGWSHGLDIRVSSIRPSMLDEWLSADAADLKNSSYNRVTLFLKQLFDLAVNDRVIVESPFERVQKGWKRPEKPVRRVPTHEEFSAIVEEIRNQTQNAEAEESANFVEFLGLAGLGQAEAASLTWGDVNWTKGEYGQLTVRRHKTRALFFPPIYPHLKPFLRRLYERYPTPPPAEERIFKIRDARKALTNACGRLKFPHFTQRSIRAYLIRRLWQAKVDVKLISKWQGHNDGGRLILSTYTEVFGSDDANYVNAELSKLSPAALPAQAPGQASGNAEPRAEQPIN